MSPNAAQAAAGGPEGQAPGAAMSVQQAAEAAVEQPTNAPVGAEAAAPEEKQGRIWCLLPRSGALELEEPESLARSISLLRPEVDLAILPSHDSVHEFAEFCKESLSLSSGQFVFCTEEQNPFVHQDCHFSSEVTSKARNFLQKTEIKEWFVIAGQSNQAVSKLAKDLSTIGNKNISILEENVEARRKYAHRGIMHRHANNLEKLSVLESLGADIALPKGFVCSTVSDLLMAWRLIVGDDVQTKVVIKPVMSTDLGILVVDAAEELKFYDFPFGDVVLQELLVSESSFDGVPGYPSVHCFQGRLLEGLQCEKVWRSTSASSVRNAHLTSELLSRIIKVSKILLAKSGMSCMGSLEFAVINQQPFLADVSLGHVTDELCMRLFIDQYAKEAAFHAWQVTAPVDLDVWTFWLRLCDKNAGFIPGKFESGVFPVHFVKNGSVTMVACGKTQTEISNLRLMAEECLRMTESKTKMESVSFNETNRRIWVQSARIEYQRVTQRYNLPARAISLLRKDLDVVILQGNHAPTKEYWDFCASILGYNENQVIFTSGNATHLDLDMEESVVNKLKTIIATSNAKWTLVPYAVTAQFESWARQFADMEVSVFGEELSWVQKYGQKGILHRHIQTPELKSVIEEIDPSIRVPKGFVCSTNEDLVTAYERLGCRQVVIKPVFGAAGEGIVFLDDVEQLKMYEFSMGDVCLEEFLDLDKAPDGLVLSPAMHYNEGVLIGKGLVDQIMCGTSYAGWRKSCVKQTFYKTANRYMECLISGTAPRGPGGVDFLSVKGFPVLSDINTGRFNGAHFPKLFMEKYAPNSSFYCWKAVPAADFGIFEFWERLVKAKLAFTPGKSKKGVFPVLYMRGMSGLLMAIGDSDEESEQLHRQADLLVRKVNKSLDLGPTVHLNPSFFKKSDITRQSGIRLWASSSSSTVRYSRSRQTCALRPLCLLRPSKDYIIMQPGDDAVTDYVEFCKQVLHLKTEQCIWTSGAKTADCLDSDVDSAVLQRIRLSAGKQPDDSLTVVPMRVSEKFQAWMSELDVVNANVFGETSAWISLYGNRRSLFRQAASFDTPSLAEEVLGTKVAQGYVCCSTAELLQAWNLIPSAKDLGAHIIAMDSHDVKPIFITSEEELRLCSFSHGELVMKAVIEMDLAHDRIPIIVAVNYMKSDLFGKGFTDVVAVGNRQQGLRPSVSSTDFQDKVGRMAEKLLEKMKPQGGGTLYFGSVKGEPMLIDVEANFISSWHTARLFAEMYAPGQPFCCWNLHPQADLDVWTFWSRMNDLQIAFFPGKSTSGIFPLMFLKDSNTAGAGTFIAIATKESELEHLKLAAEEAIRSEVSNQIMVSEGFQESSNRLWAQSPSFETVRSNAAMKFEVPCVPVPLLRPNDLIVLPGGDADVARYWEFAQDALQLSKSQAVFTSGSSASMDSDMDDHVLSQIKASMMDSVAPWTICPHEVSETSKQWLSQFAELNVDIFGPDVQTDLSVSKAILHRHITAPEEPCLLEKIDPSIRVPNGYICSTANDLLLAYELLKCTEAVIKPVATTNGEGVVFVKDAAQLSIYEFEWGDIILEEQLPVDKSPDGLILSPALHHFGGNGVDEAHVVNQIIVGSACVGYRHSEANTGFQKTARRYLQSISRKLKLRGPGKLEFLLVDGAPYLVSISAGRFCKGHAVQLFHRQHAPHSVMYAWEYRPSEACSVDAFWKRAKREGCAFQPGQSNSGIFPLSFAPGKFGFFIALAKDTPNCMQLVDKASKLLQRNVPVLPLVTQPVRSKFNLTVIKNAHVMFAPELLNSRHLLIGGTKIVGMLDDSAVGIIEGLSSDISTKIIDATDCVIVPGFVDCHVHITGGGGELGPASRTPEAKVQELIEGGMTTVVGVLGTDCVSRSLENLLTKVAALRQDGLSAYFWTGAYRLPSPTITGSVRRDICLLEHCLGAGECAISDHRGSQPTNEMIAQTAADCRVGGMLSGKAGRMYCHIGPGPGLLDPLRKCVQTTDIPIETFLPTHMERSEDLIQDGAKWVQEGGYVDFTCRSVKARIALKNYYRDGIPMERVCVSSDSYGSLPTFAEDGQLVRYQSASPKALLQFLSKMYFQELWPLERILPLMTKNPAKILKLEGKGTLAVGADADVLLLDKQTLKLKHVVALGKHVMTPKWTHGGMFGQPNPQVIGNSERSNIKLTKGLHASCCG